MSVAEPGLPEVVVDPPTVRFAERICRIGHPAPAQRVVLDAPPSVLLLLERRLDEEDEDEELKEADREADSEDEALLLLATEIDSDDDKANEEEEGETAAEEEAATVVEGKLVVVVADAWTVDVLGMLVELVSALVSTELPVEVAEAPNVVVPPV